MKTSVIIPTYHDWKRLENCIDALLKQTYPQDKFEVIIVNNDPEDSPPKFNLPENFRIISEGKPGSYTARNAGVKKAGGQILAFTDSDCIPDKNWIKNAVNLFKQKEIDLIGGKVEQFVEGKKVKSFICDYQHTFSFNQKKNVKNKISVTANLFIKTRVVKKIGLFDGGLLSGGDFEFCKRADQAGFLIIYGRDVVVMHPYRSSMHELIKKKNRTTEGDYRKNPDKLTLLYVLRSIVLILIRIKKAIKVIGFNRGIRIIPVIIYLKYIEIKGLIMLKLQK